MVWGCITATVRTALQLVNVNLTAARYRDDILQPHVILFIQNHGNNVTLQQDNAMSPELFRTSCYRKMSICWINQPFLRIYPQLNICGMKWTVDFDNFRICPLHWRNSVQHLSISGITFQKLFFRNLVSSMRRRCVACVDANGGRTRYSRLWISFSSAPSSKLYLKTNKP